jgi:hypothetical protein
MSVLVPLHLWNNWKFSNCSNWIASLLLFHALLGSYTNTVTSNRLKPATAAILFWWETGLRHEDVCGSGGIDRSDLHIGTRSRWVRWWDYTMIYFSLQRLPKTVYRYDKYLSSYAWDERRNSCISPYSVRYCCRKIIEIKMANFL